MDEFLLVVSPGVAIFLAGLGYGLVDFIRHRRPNLRAAQIRLIGLATMLGLPAIYLIYLVVVGRASPVALLGVVTMLGFSLLNVYAARGLRVPPNHS